MGKSVTASRRVSAALALLAGVGAIAVILIELPYRPILLLATVACMAVSIGSASYSITRTGGRRVVAAAAAILTAIAPMVLVVFFGNLPMALLALGLEAITVPATRFALGRDAASLKAGPTPGSEVREAARPVLLLNPKAGGGKVERFSLVEEAKGRGIQTLVLKPGDDLTHLADYAVEGLGADVIGMAGGDGSQALVAAVAMRHDVAYVCVPAGTRNHLAMDLGLDRNEVVGALDAFGPSVEQRIDLALVGERIFVNNATMGLYAKIVKSPEYRAHKVRTALDMLPQMLGPNSSPFDLRFVGPDGMTFPSAHLILVSNGRYELSDREGFGSRRRIDAGTLAIVAATFRSSRELAQFLQLHSVGQAKRFPGWFEWTDTHFEVQSGGPIEVGLDGEAVELDSPIVFRSVPGALRVRISAHAPGYSPAAAKPRRGWSTMKALLQTVAGRPLSI